MRWRVLMLKELYQKLSKTLKSDFEARLIIEERTGISWLDIISKPDSIISDEQYSNIMSDIEQRLSGKPLSRIYGKREFWGLDFAISKDTLDPRPDSELIIEVALKHFPKSAPLRILDLGTGSGCILISLLSEFKESIGFGVDLSFGATKISKENAQKNHVEERSCFICGSWVDSISGKFDLIVSNPPYIMNQIIPTLSKEVRNHDPILSLDGGDDGLTPYTIIFPQLKKLLNKGGIALFEIGYDQEKDVMRLAEESRFMQRSVHFDLSGNPRVVDISCGDK